MPTGSRIWIQPYPNTEGTFIYCHWRGGVVMQPVEPPAMSTSSLGTAVPFPAIPVPKPASPLYAWKAGHDGPMLCPLSPTWTLRWNYWLLALVWLSTFQINKHLEKNKYMYRKLLFSGPFGAMEAVLSHLALMQSAFYQPLPSCLLQYQQKINK